jgi:hypothetical protein
LAVGSAHPGFDILDLWSSQGLPVYGVAFAASAEATARPSTWRLDLPPGRSAAEEHLDAVRASMEDWEGALAEAGPRLQRLVGLESAGGLSFAAASGSGLPAAEGELLRMLSAARHDAASVSFAAPDQARFPEWQDAAAEVKRLFEQGRRLVRYYASVETAVAGQRVARTTVSWSGDLDTFWPAGVGPEAQLLHRRSLALALASRTTILRTIAVVTAGAVTIIPLLGTPGSAIMALPAIWRFVKRIRAELMRPDPVPM